MRRRSQYRIINAVTAIEMKISVYVYMINYIGKRLTKMIAEIKTEKGTRWSCYRQSDYESKGPGFIPHKGHRDVSLSKIYLLSRVLVDWE